MDAAIKKKCDLAVYKNFKADRVFAAVSEAVIYHDCPKYPDFDSCQFPLKKVTTTFFELDLELIQTMLKLNLSGVRPMDLLISRLIANQRPDDHKFLFDHPKVLILSGSALFVVLLVVGAVLYKCLRTGFHRVSTAEV